MSLWVTINITFLNLPLIEATEDGWIYKKKTNAM